jgi:MarR family transcriptional regulator, transcriptional regulator for hemolysin
MQWLGFNLLDAARLYRRQFEEHARALSLDLTECRALLTLAENERATQQRLAELIAIDPAALGRNLDRLEAGGWVERRPCPGDRRARSLAITPKANECLPLMRKIVAAAQLAAVAGLSREEIKRLAKALEHILTNEPGSKTADERI